MEDKYKSLSVPELAGEESFIRWITKGENNERWSQWLRNNPDKQASISEASFIVKALSSKTDTTFSQEEKSQLWNRINKSVNSTSTRTKPGTYFRMSWIVATAASLAILIWITTSVTVTKVYAEAGEKENLILPEQSHVTLNADSRITYHRKKFTEHRELYLDGEAFFEVEPGSKFTVSTQHGKVTVLGTSFNIISRDGMFHVSCYTGKVKVTNTHNDAIDLTAGETASVEKNDLVEASFTPTEKPMWTEGKFYFDDQPLSIIAGELERQYKVKVTMAPELRDIRLTGLFESGNLNKALYSITWPLRLRYEINDNSVIISK